MWRAADVILDPNVQTHTHTVRSTVHRQTDSAGLSKPSLSTPSVILPPPKRAAVLVNTRVDPEGSVSQTSNHDPDIKRLNPEHQNIDEYNRGQRKPPLTTSFPISPRSCRIVLENIHELRAQRWEPSGLVCSENTGAPSLYLESFTVASLLIFTHKCPGVRKSQVKYFLCRQHRRVGHFFWPSQNFPTPLHPLRPHLPFSPNGDLWKIRENYANDSSFAESRERQTLKEEEKSVGACRGGSAHHLEFPSEIRGLSPQF